MGDQWRENPAFIAQQWKPGQTGNPSGRPKNTVGKAIRDFFKKDGVTAKLAAGLLAIVESEEARPREKLEAYRLLSQLDGSLWEAKDKSHAEEEAPIKRIELVRGGGEASDGDEAESA